MPKIGVVIAIVVAVIILALVYDNYASTDVLADALGYDQPSSSDDDGTGSSSGYQSILAALASFENVASQHNNPGAICGSFTNGVCDGPKTFASIEEGTDAAIALITKKLVADPAISVERFVTNWAEGPNYSGPLTASLKNYIQHVADALGLDPSDPISDATGGDDASY